MIYTTTTSEMNMVDYLIEWSRIRYASEAYYPAKLELVNYVERTYLNLFENAASMNIHLHNKIDEEIHVYADSEMLLSILQNLISYSIETSKAGGEIIVSANKTEEGITIEVLGTSLEIPQIIIEKLLNTQTSEISIALKEKEGASLGLLVAKSFIEKNGGQIHAKNIEGIGSTFYISLLSN